jgi:tetratricopeptide (TPR) repeat protein
VVVVGILVAVTMVMTIKPHDVVESESDFELSIDDFITRGRNTWPTKDYASAERHLETAIGLAQRRKNQKKVVEAKIALAAVYQYQKKFARERQLVSQILSELKPLPYSPEYKQCLNLMFASYFQDRSNRSQELLWAQRYADYSHIHTPDQYPNTLYDLANAYRDNDRCDKGLEMLLLSERLRQRAGGTANIWALENIGTCLLCLGRYDEALPPLRQALNGFIELLRRGDNVRHSIQANRVELAWCLMQLNKRQEAQKIAQAVIEDFRKLKLSKDTMPFVSEAKDLVRACESKAEPPLISEHHFGHKPHPFHARTE